MNFIFFGSPEFAAIVLEKLIGAGFVPAAVVCNPDRPVGRKKIITPPPVKRLAANGKWQIEILQPEELKAISLKLKAIEADFAVVAAYAKIIPKEVIDIFPRGVIGVHPSLLPKYRGATPIQSAILAGEEKTGVTLYLLDEKMDHGPVLANGEWPRSSPTASRTLRGRRLANGGQTYVELYKKLAELGGQLLIEILPKFIAGEINPVPQNEAEATYTKKFTTEDAFVPPDDLEKAVSGNEKLAEEINRKIRAMNPEPGVWTAENGKRVKLLEAEVSGGKLVLKKIQHEGKTARTL